MSEIIAENINEQKAIDIDNACIILCRYACPYKIDSNKCFNAKCDTWEMFRRMMEESTIKEENEYCPDYFNCKKDKEHSLDDFIKKIEK